MLPIDGVVLPGVVVVDDDPVLVPEFDVLVPELDVMPLPCPLVVAPEPFRAVVLVDDPAGLPICAPVFAPGAVGSHGLRGVARWPG